MNGVYLVCLELLQLSCAPEGPLAGVALVVLLCMLFPLVDLHQHTIESQAGCGKWMPLYLIEARAVATADSQRHTTNMFSARLWAASVQPAWHTQWLKASLVEQGSTMLTQHHHLTAEQACCGLLPVKDAELAAAHACMLALCGDMFTAW